MKKLFPLAVLMVLAATAFSQKTKTENVVIVTLDGMRWQELFKGYDSVIGGNKNYNHSGDEMAKTFGAASAVESRKKLFPFIWNTIAQQGQLYGNRRLGNNVNNANPYWFSYPGYNEIFTGYPDTAVNSNDKNYNKNVNVLEFINQQHAYKGKVAAFATWDVFGHILNAPRSGVYVNAGVDTVRFKEPTLNLLNEMQFLAPQPLGVRPDVITYFAGREYLKTYKPKVLYIAFDETDGYAHGGLYDQYLKSAHAEDAMIADLWATIQSMPEYRNKTTLIITTDHGRGDKNKDEWRDHGQKINDANQIWIAAIGPDTKPLGEVTAAQTLYQAQIAATIGKLLGFEFKANHTVQPAIESMYK